MATKLAINVEERTYSISIECPEGGPYRVIARRHQILTKQDGTAVRDAEGRLVEIPGGERAIERTVDGADLEAAEIAKMVSAKIDKWAQEA